MSGCTAVLTFSKGECDGETSLFNNLEFECLRPGGDVPSLRSGPLAPAPLEEELYSPSRE